ncbi:hypothetical protein D3C84_310140 [compost metagenome]
MKRVPVANLPLVLLLLSGSPYVLATEGSVGRPITGQIVYSNAGIIPPEPGWVVSATSIYYDGELSKSKPAPVRGEVGSGLKMKVSYTMTNITRIWDTGKGRWNFASAVGLPVQYTDAEVDLTGPRGHTVRETDYGTQFADALITPIAAGYHFSATDHIAMSLPIYVPTGAYDKDRLANAGQNTYTFMPTLAYTHLYEKGGEFSLLGAFELYTRNDATDYQNGSIFRLDGLWTHGLGNGWAAGVVGGVIKQVTDDEGPTADQLNGFRGHSAGVGPYIGWSGKFSDAQASINARWVSEFDSVNRPEGDGVSVNLTLAFF